MTTKKVPTVAKVQEMIDNSLGNNGETKITSIDTTKQKIKIIGDPDVYNYGPKINKAGCDYAYYQIIDSYSIQIWCLQSSSLTDTFSLYVNDSNGNLITNISYAFKDDWDIYSEDDSAINSILIDVTSISIPEEYKLQKLQIMIKQNDSAYGTAYLQYVEHCSSITTPTDTGVLTFAALRDLIYPIGAIYLSMNNINPKNFIGGTWEQIKDAFLFCSDTFHQSGGSKKITIDNLPSHYHDLIGRTEEVKYFDETSGITTKATIYTETYKSWKGVRNWDTKTKETGSGTDYMPPYFSIYAWRRIE